MSKTTISKNGLSLRGKSKEIQMDIQNIIKEHGEKISFEKYLQIQEKKTA